MVEELKVVHISTSVSGGAGTAAFRIHEALLEKNVQSTFLSLNPNTNGNCKNCLQLQKPAKHLVCRAFDKSIRLLGNVFGCKISKLIYYQNELKKVSPYLQAEWTSLPFSQFDILSHPVVQKADIIHLHWVAGMLDYPSFFKRNKKPVVWTLHDMNPFQGIFHYYGDEQRNEKIAGLLNKEIFRAKEKVIKSRKCKISVATPSNWLRSIAINSPLYSNSSVTTINNPISLTQVHRLHTQQLKQSLSIDSENTIFLFIAQEVKTYRKGFALLLTALAQLSNRNVTLLVIGVTTKITLPGFQVIELGSIYDQELLSKYYSLAHAFIIPSLEDNLPNVMLEAMACGTPVISFNVGGMAEVIRDGFNGFKSPVLNASSLKETLEKFIENRSLFNAQEISDFVNANFSYSCIGEKYIALYKDCLPR